VSACETAVTTTVEGFGNTDGAVYRPPEVIVPTVEFPPATPATSQFTAVFVVPVTVALKGTVCPTTTDVALGDTITLIGVVFPPPLAEFRPLHPALHKMARVRRSFPSRHIVVPRTFTHTKVSMRVLGHRDSVISL
jgi:hypothetical protein